MVDDWNSIDGIADTDRDRLFGDHQKHYQGLHARVLRNLV